MDKSGGTMSDFNPVMYSDPPADGMNQMLVDEPPSYAVVNQPWHQPTMFAPYGHQVCQGNEVRLTLHFSDTMTHVIQHVYDGVDLCVFALHCNNCSKHLF